MLILGSFNQVPGQSSGESYDVLTSGQSGIYLMPVTEEASMVIARYGKPGCPMGVRGEVVVDGEYPVVKAARVWV